MAELKCWRCGAELAELSLPLSRLDQCPDCSVDLHVCRMCEQFDAGVVRQCCEDGAEEQREKARANFCDWFSPSGNAFSGAEVAAETQARATLDSLFGAPDETEDAPQDDAFKSADDLFK